MNAPRREPSPTLPPPQHAWWRRSEALGLLAFLLPSLLAVFAVAWLDGSGALDRAWLLAFRVAGHPDQLLGGASALQLAREVTSLGSPWFLFALVLGSAAVLLLEGRQRLALFLLGATGSGALMNTLLKAVFARPRPDLVPHEALVHTPSFPSGHAFGAAMVFLTLAALLSRRLRTPQARSALVLMACGVALAVGVSRVALGVHWPSDVLAGWALGSAWAVLAWRLSLLWVPEGSTPAAMLPPSQGPG